MDSLQYCTTEREGRLFIVTINRPERMNALHPPANAELETVWNEFAEDPDLWVAIITGAGEKAFCAGNDLRYQADGGEMFRVKSGFMGLTKRYDMTKPVIAAVNGVAMGGGFEGALATDLIIASENAVFALPEPRVGLAAIGGGVHRLPRQIGLKRAMGMLLTGRRVTPAEGKDLGFVNDVVPAGQALEGARKWANDILECAPLSIRATKQMVMKGLDEANLGKAFDEALEYPAAVTLRESEDYIEGPKAFSEKRAPQWKGR